MAVFIAIGILTQYLTYQQYLLHKDAELDKVAREARLVADKIKTSISHSLSATKTLAFLVEKYGVPKDFDSVAASILESNKFIDALELTRKGVITHVFPLEGNKQAIGYDVLADSSRNRDALEALARRELFFAGPLELRQGGISVVGRLPIFKSGEFWGFSVVLIKLSTLLKAAGIEHDNGEFTYQLSRQNSVTGKEEFFLQGPLTLTQRYSFIEVPDGEWKLYVMPKNQAAFASAIIPFALLGVMLSMLSGFLAWHWAGQPDKLKSKVNEVTASLSAYQRSASRSLEHVNRLFHFTSRINHLMVHVRDESVLYREVCRIAIEVGKFRLAWVGIINEAEQKMYAVSSAGDLSGYLAEVTPIPIDANAIEGPAKRMLATGTYVNCNDIASNSLMSPWAEKAVSRGYRSSIILPIKLFEKIIGSLNLYSHEANSFDDNEIQLLLETTSNISFTLENFEKERRRVAAEEQIQSEKILSDSIINSLPGIFYLYNREGNFLRWNKNFETVSGYTAEEIKNMVPLDFFPEHEKPLLKAKIDSVFLNGYDDVIANFYTKEKQRITYFFNGRRVNFGDEDYLIGTGLDITAQVNAENELLERAEEIEKLSNHLQNVREEERSRIALEIHDVLGQQLTALKMDATWLKKRSYDNEITLARIGSMISLIDDTIKTVRRISSELRPGILDDLGLIAALEWQASEFEKNTGIPVKFESKKNDVVLERNFSTNIFRIYQEALTNIARHANATQVNTKFVYEGDHIQLEIADNGVGIDFNEVHTKKSLGLISMKARARLFAGDVLVTNLVPHGTVVTLKVPVSKNEN